MGSQINFTVDDSLRDFLGFELVVLHEKFNSSPNPIDMLSFDNIFIETNIAIGMIFNGKWTGIMYNFTMEVNPVLKWIETFRG